MVARSIINKERNYIFPKKNSLRRPKPPESGFCGTGGLRRNRAHRVNVGGRCFDRSQKENNNPGRSDRPGNGLTAANPSVRKGDIQVVPHDPKEMCSHAVVLEPRNLEDLLIHFVVNQGAPAEEILGATVRLCGLVKVTDQ
ncbi:hypothetical protein AVEN_182184-1 [Araneus ventricosus]|uniref:Uncharacterized protein n=1 Tax=Araneus ventricosus TaxID=182803 RepID=A0A4Y2UUL4_ARAVE|nr:hypothetical protein AVEN_182184-1 [Araneus ventricosus]